MLKLVQKTLEITLHNIITQSMTLVDSTGITIFLHLTFSAANYEMECN